MLHIGRDKVYYLLRTGQLRSLPGGDAMTLIAATGWGQEKDRQRAFDAGFDHHLTKPIDFARLRLLLPRA